ncbi:hypothetical protein EAY25_15765 [Escherichia coli]|nr:hypothetical protein [Escherichia coli]EFO1804938.1 hypothetical protein [Escherichia coli]UMS61346.1 hypothetical protein AOY73_03820 [Escherichia coli]
MLIFLLVLEINGNLNRILKVFLIFVLIVYGDISLYRYFIDIRITDTIIALLYVANAIQNTYHKSHIK